MLLLSLASLIPYRDIYQQGMNASRVFREQGGDFAVFSSIFYHIISQSSGGAIYIACKEATFECRFSSFDQCSSSEIESSGGALYIATYAALFANNCGRNNTAPRSYNFAFISADSVFLHSCLICNHHSPESRSHTVICLANGEASVGYFNSSFNCLRIRGSAIHTELCRIARIRFSCFCDNKGPRQLIMVAPIYCTQENAFDMCNFGRNSELSVGYIDCSGVWVFQKCCFFGHNEGIMVAPPGKRSSSIIFRHCAFDTDPGTKPQATFDDCAEMKSEVRLSLKMGSLICSMPDGGLSYVVSSKYGLVSRMLIFFTLL